jgi:HK97 gp10 family phage protein
MPKLDHNANPTIEFDINPKEVLKGLKNIRLTEAQMLAIEKAGAAVVINKQKMLVPVDTGATKTSIRQHIEKSSEKRVWDRIGPETTYSFWIEFGNSNPNYPVQPFVRPSANEGMKGRIRRAMAKPFTEELKKSWR